MKYLLATTCALFITLAVAAQDYDFKPRSGDVTAEVNFEPFDSNPVSINYLRFRFFNSEQIASRLGVSIGGRIENPSEDLQRRTLEINIRPGFERHFYGTERLSPYIGGEMDLAFKTARVEDDSNNSEIDGAWSLAGQERGFFRFGFNFVFGADFYVAKRLYLGTEFGYGFEFIDQADIEERRGTTGITTNDGGNTLQIGPNFNSSIRLGFSF